MCFFFCSAFNESDGGVGGAVVVVVYTDICMAPQTRNGI